MQCLLSNCHHVYPQEEPKDEHYHHHRHQNFCGDIPIQPGEDYRSAFVPAASPADQERQSQQAQHPADHGGHQDLIPIISD